MKKVMTLTALAAACLLATTAMAQDKAPAASPTLAAIADAMGAREKMTAVGVVQSVDLQSRLVSIKDYPDGRIFTIHAGPEVRNLAQIGPGSVIKVEYHEALALALDKVQSGGINVRQETVSAGRTPAGGLPGGTIQESVKMLGTILAIDKEKRKVLIQGAIHHVSLRIPADMDLKDLKVGDQVAATYVQELGIAVGPAPTPSLKERKVGNE
jgi:Cu/Ag efflux protein CusF